MFFAERGDGFIHDARLPVFYLHHIVLETGRFGEYEHGFFRGPKKSPGQEKTDTCQRSGLCELTTIENWFHCSAILVKTDPLREDSSTALTNLTSSTPSWTPGTKSASGLGERF